MRILQVTKKVPWPAKDGESIAIDTMMRGLIDAGHELCLLAMSTSKHPAAPAPRWVEENVEVIVVEVDTSVKSSAAFLNLFSGNSYNLERFYSEAFSDRLRKLLRKSQFDLVQLEGLYLAPYLNVLHAVSPAPVVMRAHNVEYEIWERLAQTAGKFWLRPYFSLLAKRLRKFEVGSLNAYSAIVPISSKDEEKFRELGATVPMHTSPVGLFLQDYLHRESERSPSDNPSIGFLGALDWIPNQEALHWFIKEVWPGLRSKHPDLRFQIAGRHGADEWLRLDIDGIDYLGEVPSAPDFLESQDVVVVPLLSGSGMRIKIVEAMALARPIVCSSIAAEGVKYEDGMHLAIGDDPDSFIARCSELLADPEQRMRMGDEARKLCRDHHDMEQLIFQLLAFYQQTFGIA